MAKKTSKKTKGKNIRHAAGGMSLAPTPVTNVKQQIASIGKNLQPNKGKIVHQGGLMIKDGVPVGSSALTRGRTNVGNVGYVDGKAVMSVEGKSPKTTTPKLPTLGTRMRKTSGGSSVQKTPVEHRDGLMYRNGKAVGTSALTRPQARQTAVTTGATKPITSPAQVVRSTVQQPVMSYAQAGNNDLQSITEKLQEEATQYEKPELRDFKRERMREMRDQINVLERLRAEEIARQQEMDRGEQNKLRAILASAGTLGTAYAQGAETKQNEADIRDAASINNRYALPIAELQATATEKAFEDYKNAIINSAIERGLSTPQAIAGFANQMGVPLSTDEIQGALSLGGASAGESGVIPATDAVKFGVPYGTTYEQLRGRTIGNQEQIKLANSQKAKIDSTTAVLTSLQQYRNLYDRLVGGTGANITGQDAALLSSLYNSTMFQMAQAVGTGALQAADRAVIEQIIPNPANVGGAITSVVQGGKAGGLGKIDQAIQAIQNIQNGIYQSAGANYQPAGASAPDIDINQVDAAIDALL